MRPSFFAYSFEYKVMLIRILTVWLVVFIAACSTSVPNDEQVIASSPTNPNVQQRAIEVSTTGPERGEPEFRPVRVDPFPSVKVPTGSLFDPDNLVGLYQRNNRYRVGDMILVQLAEKTSSKKSLNFKRDKSGNFTLDPVTVNAGSLKINGDNLNADFEQENEFDSSAETKQNNSLEGDVTVYVLEIMPNGNLLVAGEKWMTLNKGEEYIRFSGEIRPTDIDNDNTVSSVKIGNSRIEFSGKGELQDNQESSILGKLFGILE
ncbi:flagellar L-ring protein [Paraglaciecola polaris LMG 21857]|uniref:Flagellar L-ring protein n=2 Tax=Paraglaciecola polaris TaxID=222814 RepID=K6Z5W4_9ALTE|nr:flagellar L-ring protein [Paraglaciecola polaris LMG 21857]